MGLSRHGHGKHDSPSYGLRGVHALVLVGGRQESERFGKVPYALLDVLGRSVLLRTVDRLRTAGIEEISVLSDSNSVPLLATSLCKFSVAAPEDFWEESLKHFRQLARHSECVLVIRLGAWAEVDWAAMVGEHRRLGSVIVRACSRKGQVLDMFVVSARSQTEAAALLRGELSDDRIVLALHRITGYANLLATAVDRRSLILDAFAGANQIRPCGRELRPGVWVGKGTRIHRSARIIAPSFIGDHCNVHRDAVVTRGSSLEHHSEVDCATVIDSSCVMPYTRVGVGLDVEHSVVGFGQVYSISRRATVEISDKRLIGEAVPRFSTALFSLGSWLYNYMPVALWKLLSPSPETQPISISATEKKLHSSKPALGDSSLSPVESQTEDYREMTASRRYENE